MMDDCGELVVSGRFGSWGLRAWEVRVGVGGWGLVEDGGGGVFRVVRVVQYSIYYIA